MHFISPLFSTYVKSFCIEIMIIKPFIFEFFKLFPHICNAMRENIPGLALFLIRALGKHFNL